MHIYPLEDIRVDASATQLLHDVSVEADSFKALGTFPPEVQAELQRSFLPERISDTLNIESIRVNPRLTKAILDGLAISDTDRYSEQEILNISAANDLIESEAKNHSSLSSRLVLELHRRIEEKLIKQAGSFREQNVQITGASYTPPEWADVPDLIRHVIHQLEKAIGVDPVIAAVWTHATIAKIHPFFDGNGRTSRMVQDFLLLRASLLPVGVPLSRRSEYYEALESADHGDFSNVVGIIAAAELVALDKAKRIALAPHERRSKIKNLVKAANTKVKQTEYNQYEFWRRKTEGFISELTTWLDELNAESSDFKLQWRIYKLPSFDKWCEICEKGWAQNTWALQFDVEAKGRLLHRFLFYAKRHRLDWVTDPDASRKNQVGLFLTSVPDRETRWNLNRYSDPYISFREAIFELSGSRFYEDPEVGNCSSPDGVSVTLRQSHPWHPARTSASADAIESLLEQILIKLGLLDT